MDGIHDMGGMDGFGSIEHDDDFYHESWEAKADAIDSAMIGKGYWGVSELRHARARLEPAVYLTSSYMGRKLAATEMLCIEKGAVTTDELLARIEEVGTAEEYDDGLPTREDPDLARGIRRHHYEQHRQLGEQKEPAYDVGQRVRVKNVHPEGHTRCPEYVRRAHGEVVRHNPTTELPDAKVPSGLPGDSSREFPTEPLYSVSFDAEELWGAERSEGHTVTLELWESYIEAADE